MSTTWPRWATLRAEAVRAELTPDQRGPWRENLNCRQSTPVPGVAPAEPHPAEPPYFFHCAAHIDAIRRVHGTAKPLLARDQGLCISCRKPAVKRPITMGAAVACVKAEQSNSTVARLSTTRYCEDCKPARRPPCGGRTCRRTANPNRTQPAGCCSVTESGKRLHCARCCATNQDRKLQRDKSAKASRMGLASGIARRNSSDERKEKVRQMQRAGMKPAAMAQQLGVSMTTVRNHLREIRSPTEAARKANVEASNQRRQTIARMHAAGATPEDIAAQVEVTTATVKSHLRALRGTPMARDISTNRKQHDQAKETG